MTAPIKRHPSLQSISRDHHEGLLISFKIEKGMSENVEASVMQKHIDWFFEKKLLPHFKIEEEFVFPVLGNEHELIRAALDQHAELVRLFGIADKNYDTLKLIGELLDAHIRFEERILFNEIQAVATPEQLQLIEASHINAPNPAHKESK